MSRFVTYRPVSKGSATKPAPKKKLRSHSAVAEPNEVEAVFMFSIRVSDDSATSDIILFGDVRN